MENAQAMVNASAIVDGLELTALKRLRFSPLSSTAFIISMELSTSSLSTVKVSTLVSTGK